MSCACCVVQQVQQLQASAVSTEQQLHTHKAEVARLQNALHQQKALREAAQAQLAAAQVRRRRRKDKQLF